MKNKQLLAFPLLAGALFLGTSCNNSKTNQELTSGVIRQNMDTTIAPGDNFTAYVNGNWIKNTEIPADKAAYGIGAIINDRAQDDVKAIIENAAKGNPDEGSEEQKIGDFYDSYINMKVRDSIGLTPLNEEFKKIEALSSVKDLASYFAYANKIGNTPPFSLGITEDFKNPKKYTLYTWQDGLGLPDREYYLQKDPKSVDIRTKYVAHIEKMLSIAGIADAKAKAAQIMALETLMASKQMKKEDTRDIAKLYNKYAIKDLNTLMPDFDWKTLLSEAGIKNPDTLMVAQVAYTKDLNAIIKNTPLDTWKTYLKWNLINGSASYLNSALDNQNFEFYSKTLHGVKEQKPQWRRAVSVVNGGLGEMVGKLYVEKHFPPAAKERMLQLVQNLLKAYEISIKELDWMSPDTKKQALDKISKFTPKIGYPDK